ncbi:FosA family fosfomycin resistance glutathione transferase [Cronobacter sakazakii]|uniref:FosA family fosfomycin resistance glutathione transferase n=1 Tax=Cronobacter sakazakii TaxID=28141 RepID=UPI000DA1F510|nr:FosA family fosfomycin resistance glutathione transferase [Cronobacter sakazakii]EJK9926311.1 FosA family fosfomycin resistance glutathione transferase [Cronobacter sakazakii]EJK9929391.1 FosA family fosfomycin resistance glutathione transferase [Cronobacter sakazakii]ELY4057036.1 FosA family fosfomycin resistance glutathione transferase [Cronobacter sakazakii]ELY4057966.1 FosA family fosfomycin resistance glutathione transferase [Cronobacter sakazakii]ELY6153410.1 FosA family fosfomycin re
MLSGLNHLTLAVRDVAQSLAFYHSLLGLRLHARWDGGAYLSCGALWLCLSQDDSAGQPAADYTHYAFTVSETDFPLMVDKLAAAGVKTWKTNRSEGDSWYFLDPDGHQLELHVGSLATRLAACRAAPYKGMRFYD